MSFAAMANGVQDPAEAELWSARTEVLLQSMREYVRNGGLRPSAAPLDDQMPEMPEEVVSDSSASDESLTLAHSGPSGAVSLHSFPIGRDRSGGAEAGAPKAAVKGLSAVGRGPPDNLWVAEHVGIPLCESMVAYRKVCWLR